MKFLDLLYEFVDLMFILLVVELLVALVVEDAFLTIARWF